MGENYKLLEIKCPNTCYQILNKDQDDETICFGYSKKIFKQIFFYLIIILTLGVAYLLFYWKPEWKLFLTCSLSDLEKCHFVLLQDSHNRYFVERISYIQIKDEIKILGSSNHKENQTISSGYQNEPIETKKFIRYFKFQMLRYFWKNESKFSKLDGLDQNTPCNNLLNDFKGYSLEVQNLKLEYFGDNSIEVKVKSYFRLFVEEVLSPFYMFQVAACALWLIDNYYYYAACIIMISLISMIVSLFETKRQAQTLHDMTQTHFKINVCRGNDVFEEVATERLVPGDIIEIPDGHETTLACDAVLLNGTCIVNESMLTGESVPVIKTPLPHPEDVNEIYDIETHKRNTLFNGTRVVQTRNYEKSKVLALVVRTGFNTTKGDLVRSILFPKPMGFKFYQDSMRFIFFMFMIATIGMIYGCIVLYFNKVSIEEIIIRALDIVTIVVPPALPAAMTVGTVYAQSRLKKKSIYCISPPRINIGGKLKLICFDKTGTLTEDGLDLWGVVEVDKQINFKHPINNLDELNDGSLLRTLVTCHSLSRYDGVLTGDPLDIKMFESTKWSFVDEHLAGSCKFEQVVPVVKQNNFNEDNNLEIAIIKQFTFSSSLLRMSVLCKTLNSDCLDVFTKGAPEKISELCRPETIPHNFNESLRSFTANGYRVIALAGKSLDPSINWLQGSKLPRDSIESNLEFHGFLIMQNKIKYETYPVINELKNAGLRTIMVTGDNLLTALNVAHTCGMIPKSNQVILVEAHPEQHSQTTIEEQVPARIEWKLAEPFVDLEETNQTYQLDVSSRLQTAINFDNDAYNFAITGKSFAVLRKRFPGTYEKILLNSTIFARMSPDQKAQLVEDLISIGYCVSMCGDGANDCGALKAAHVGISLSEAEASVAAPFTSKIQNISCVPEIIKEGRAALVTSFGVFKYMALYSMIQFISVLILYAFDTNLSDPQFLYVDLFLITPVAIFMSANSAYEKISKKRPLGSLISFVNICSIMFQILLVFTFQIGILFYTLNQTWYRATHEHKIKNNATMEGTSVFLISTFQYVCMAFVFSKGPPFRKPLIENVPFVSSLVFLTAVNIWLAVSPLEFVLKFLTMKSLDPQNPVSLFRFSIIGIAFFFFIVSYILEEAIVHTSFFKKLGRKILRKKHPKNKYKIIKKDLENDHGWPIINKITFE